MGVAVVYLVRGTSVGSNPDIGAGGDKQSFLKSDNVYNLHLLFTFHSDTPHIVKVRLCVLTNQNIESLVIDH